MSKPLFELADIVKDYRISFEQKHQPLKQHLRVLNAIEHCRTAYLGGHVDKCDNTQCNHIRISHNSCRNRHCPKCQGTNREQWIEARQKDMLPVPYFHVVFTVPHELNTYCLNYPKELYNILFATSKETMVTLGNDPKLLGAQIGIVSVLHTWGQNLMLHPHVHMIVPGGGFTPAGYWKQTKCVGKYLFPGGVMSKMFRGKFMEKLMLFLTEHKIPLDVVLRKKLYNLNWNVNAKQPFGGPLEVIEYLGRYSHKIAISNHRIKTVGNGKVTFSYKDYADGAKQKLMTLEAEEFLRRFCLHVLPPGFMKIRHYGILASRVKPLLRIQQMQMGVLIHNIEKVNWKEISKRKLNFDVDACPCCKTGKMIRILSFDANAPPPQMLSIAKRKTN